MYIIAHAIHARIGCTYKCKYECKYASICYKYACTCTVRIGKNIPFKEKQQNDGYEKIKIDFPVFISKKFFISDKVLNIGYRVRIG